MPMIQAGSANIYYASYGQGEQLVFVTGFSGDHTAWQSLIDVYAAKYQVIVFDNRGCGKTKSPTFPYITEILADDAANLVRALGIGKAHFIGASFGGCIVQTIAYKYPELTKSIVITNSFSQANTRLKLYAATRLELMKAGAPEESIVKFITLLCWSKKYLNRPGMVDQLVKTGFFPITPKGYESQMHALTTFNSREWLNKIQCPSLVIAGDDDILATAEEGEYMSKAIPNAEFFCLHDVGHVPYIEQPEMFNSRVLEFLCKHK